MVFYFENTEKDIILIEKVKKIIEIIKNVDFVEKIESDKVRDHCHLTGKYRGVAHTKCKKKCNTETK